LKTWKKPRIGNILKPEKKTYYQPSRVFFGTVFCIKIAMIPVNPNPSPLPKLIKEKWNFLS